MSQHDVHALLVKVVQQGMEQQGLTQTQLARLSGVPQGNISAIFRGKAASEASWQKLFDAAWP